MRYLGLQWQKPTDNAMWVQSFYLLQFAAIHTTVLIQKFFTEQRILRKKQRGSLFSAMYDMLNKQINMLQGRNWGISLL
jgi:hypothetical protein